VAAGRRVLLIVTDVSKTGLIIPSLAAPWPCVGAIAHQIDILIDACQFRLSPKTLRAYLQRGLLVAMTGSNSSPAHPSPAPCSPRPKSPSGSGLAMRGIRHRLLAGEWPAHWRPERPWPGAPTSASCCGGRRHRHLRAFSALPEYEVAAFLARFQNVVAEAAWKSPPCS